jgi:hypothetical protein
MEVKMDSLKPIDDIDKSIEAFHRGAIRKEDFNRRLKIHTRLTVRETLRLRAMELAHERGRMRIAALIEDCLGVGLDKGKAGTAELPTASLPSGEERDLVLWKPFFKMDSDGQLKKWLADPSSALIEIEAQIQVLRANLKALRSR